MYNQINQSIMHTLNINQPTLRTRYVNKPPIGNIIFIRVVSLTLFFAFVLYKYQKYWFSDFGHFKQPSYLPSAAFQRVTVTKQPI